MSQIYFHLFLKIAAYLHDKFHQSSTIYYQLLPQLHCNNKTFISDVQFKIALLDLCNESVAMGSYHLLVCGQIVRIHPPRLPRF